MWTSASSVRRLDGIDALFGDEVAPIVRIQLNWHTIQPSRGAPIDWSRIDEQVAQAEQRGMRVLLLLAYAPTWANGSSNIVWFPTDDADWKAIVDATVAHFGERIQAYEVWNEPNMVGVFGGYDLVPPVQRYWQLVRIAHESVHAGCATCTMVGWRIGVGQRPPGTAAGRRNGCGTRTTTATAPTSMRWRCTPTRRGTALPPRIALASGTRGSARSVRTRPAGSLGGCAR